MSRYYYDSDNSSDFPFGLCIALIIICMILGAILDDAHVSSEREKSNMIWIKEGYCYDADTKIIYREAIVDGGRYGNDTPTYSPYINENGNYCKYKNGKWVEFIK